MKLFIIGAAFLATASAQVCHLYSNSIESPCFDAVKNTTNYQIRQYGDTDKQEFWTDAHIDTELFSKAQNDGFQSNFDYISGGNDAEMKIPMTAPVIFRKNHSKGGWQVSFFVPSKFESKEDIPTPKDPSVGITSFQGTYAVTVFPGFASEADFLKYEAELKSALKQDGVDTKEDPEWGHVWAGYDSPFVFVNRHNEVWIRLA